MSSSARARNYNRAAVATAARALTPAESGQTIFLNSTSEFALTLPAPGAGLRYNIFVKAAPTGASYTVVTASSSNVIKGQVYTTDVNSATDADFETSGGDTVSFVDGKAVAGDSAEFFCDGTYWYVRAFCSVFDAITISAAS